jgi:hypothetical protein
MRKHFTTTYFMQRCHTYQAGITVSQLVHSERLLCTSLGVFLVKMSIAKVSYSCLLLSGICHKEMHLQ